MNDFHNLIGFCAGVSSFIAFVFYYISIFKKKTSPNRATWLILTIVGILIASSYYDVGARETIWVPMSYILGPFIVFLLSIKYGEGGWEKFDKFCLGGSLASAIFWWFSGFSILTLLINIFIDFLGILPTIKKVYFNPKSEAFFPWGITFFSSILNLIAVNNWVFDIWIYPIYAFLINGFITFFLFFPIYKNFKIRSHYNISVKDNLI